MTDKLRVGILGGGIGKSHIRAFQNLPEQFEVLAFGDIDAARAQEVSQTLNIERAVTSLDDLCAMDDLDAISICTPNHLHVLHTKQVLSAGKHAICEKPVAGSLQEIDDLLRAEAESGKRVMPIFQFRFGHGIQKLKRLQEAGVTGRAYLSTVETAWRRRAAYYAAPWRGKWETEMGGALVTLAIHAHDILNYILGPTQRVMAQTATLVNPIETEDSVSASLQMAAGSLAALSVTTGSSKQITRHRFCFENLVAESNTEPYSNTSDPWTFTGDTPEIDEQIRAVLADIELLPEGHAGQFYRFYQALQTGDELPVTLNDARISAELITAIYHSAETGRAVNLPIAKDHLKYRSWIPSDKIF
jgi:predicted dehydrogenase